MPESPKLHTYKLWYGVYNWYEKVHSGTIKIDTRHFLGIFGHPNPYFSKCIEQKTNAEIKASSSYIYCENIGGIGTLRKPFDGNYFEVVHYSQLIGRLFSPSQKIKKMNPSIPTVFCVTFGTLGIHVHHEK